MEKIQIGFPYTVLEPLTRALNIKLQAAVKDSVKAPIAAPRWRPELNSLEVPITAHVPALTFSARDLARLKEGDVLTWNAEAVNQIRLTIAALPKFSGRLGQSGKHWAVEITKILRT